jgi:hypothetical protein
MSNKHRVMVVQAGGWISGVGKWGRRVKRKISICILVAVIIMTYLVSMTTSVHLNWGSKAANQGYPSIRSSSSRSVIRNCICFSSFPVQISRLMYSWIRPALLLVPLIFHIFFGRSSFWVPNPSRLISLGSIKLSVAPESTSMFLSAIAHDVQNETGIFILQYQVRYTELHCNLWIARPQADGLELRKNPVDFS